MYVCQCVLREDLHVTTNLNNQSPHVQEEALYEQWVYLATLLGHKATTDTI